MEETLNIYKRVNLVMKEVTYVQKENKKVNNQYTFVSHDAVARTLHEPMAKHGIVMIPTIVDLEQDGNRTKVKMDISFVNIDNPTDKITITQYGYGIDPQDKGIGKAQSYAVKYALLKLFCLETGDDVEKDNIDYKPEKKIIKQEMIEEEEECTEEIMNKKFDAFLNKYPKPDHELIRLFIEKYSNHWKKSYIQSMNDFIQKNMFENDFNKFKDKESKKNKQKEAA
jgi:hypothetical protein